MNARISFSLSSRRFDPSFKNLVERVHQGELGKIHTVKTVARDSPLPPMDYIKTSSICRHNMVSLQAWFILFQF